MAIRMDYEVRRLPESFTREVDTYSFKTIENGRRNRWGELPQKMVKSKTTERGGVMIVVKGKPGHSMRFTSLEQLLDFKLIDHDEYLELADKPDGILHVRPRLIDTNTGEVVNEYGIPKNIAHELENGTTLPKAAGRRANGNVETDIDVNTTGDEDIAGDEVPLDDGGVTMAGEEHVAAQIDETE